MIVKGWVQMSVVGALLGVARMGSAQSAVPAAPIKAPVLLNRAAIITQRDRLSAKLVGKHDTVTVRVFVLIDSLGYVYRPEVKQEVKDERLKKAAIALVTNMRFSPARQNGRPKPVLLTIPVRFARPLTK